MFLTLYYFPWGEIIDDALFINVCLKTLGIKLKINRMFCLDLSFLSNLMLLNGLKNIVKLFRQILYVRF